MFNKAKRKGHLVGLVPHLFQGGVTHLQYADDTVVLFEFRVSDQEAQFVANTFNFSKGNNVRFWEDKWIGDVSFHSKFYGLYAVSDDQGVLVNSVYEDGWETRFKRSLSINENDMWIELMDMCVEELSEGERKGGSEGVLRLTACRNHSVGKKVKKSKMV
ncbi:hypothetical protein GUJ93_ZPchr0002g23157 [Zizania palustris]|uniref:Uncharacterized protein n=1 Tax=Zizania palustris TaxID=103762 RepID=A0A8J5S3P5_ZIZPA|nr:hypothetical protein GUJ93_ZPchr0002g23157 [Zizania palustris]